MTDFILGLPFVNLFFNNLGIEFEATTPELLDVDRAQIIVQTEFIRVKLDHRTILELNHRVLESNGERAQYVELPILDAGQRDHEFLLLACDIINALTPSCVHVEIAPLAGWIVDVIDFHGIPHRFSHRSEYPSGPNGSGWNQYFQTVFFKASDLSPSRQALAYGDDALVDAFNALVLDKWGAIERSYNSLNSWRHTAKQQGRAGLDDGGRALANIEAYELKVKEEIAILRASFGTTVFKVATKRQASTIAGLALDVAKDATGTAHEIEALKDAKQVHYFTNAVQHQADQIKVVIEREAGVSSVDFAYNFWESTVDAYNEINEYLDKAKGAYAEYFIKYNSTEVQ